MALAASGNELFVGGNFSTVGGTPANCVAQWDGSAWSALGSGTRADNPVVYALAVSGADLYAGGAFTIAGGKASAYIVSVRINILWMPR